MIEFRKSVTLLWLGLLAAPSTPVDAQVYPERIREVTRAVVVQPRVERYQRDSQRATQEERISKTVRIGATGEVDVSNISGDITVTRGGGNDVVVEVIKTARARTTEEAKEALKFVQVEIQDRPNRVEIRSHYGPREDPPRRNWRNINVSVVFNITAPERASITVNSLSGSVSVNGIKGSLELETLSGNVRLANVGRIAQAKTASGDVEIIDTSVEGVMEASTMSGTLTLRNVKARQLDLGSVSGDVVVDQVSCERVEAQSISGSVRLSGPLVRGGRYELGSHSGEVHVAISGDVGFEVEATSFSGTVRTDLQLKLSGISKSGYRDHGQRSIRGTYGDGSAFLDLTTFSGRIILTKK
jgi:DUF4097 and DUF4098 domain-containing protein YvlB